MDFCAGAAEASDELPFVGFFIAKPRGVNGGVVIAGLDAGKEAIGFSGLPWVFQKALSSGPLASEFLSADVFSFCQRGDTIFFRDGIWVVGVKRTPDREEDPAFGRTFDLETKVTLSKTVRHEVGTDWIFSVWNSDFTVSPFDFFPFWNLVAKMHGRPAATPVKHIIFVRFNVIQLQVVLFRSQD